MTTLPARYLDLPSLPYAQAWALMKSLAQARREGRVGECLLILEHEPVITLGRRARPEDILVSQGELAARGVAVFRVERGGLVTCHGPGQLVAYVIFHLPTLGLGVAELVRRLEEAAIKALGGFGVEAGRREGHPGVWVGQDKIASLGVAVKGGVTFHGLALNYGPSLPLFDLVVPCGLSGVRMTSLAQLLGREVEAGRLRRLLAQGLAQVFALDLRPWSLSEAWETAGLGNGQAPT